MQVKVFEAEDMRSALEKVKKTLGPDALILSSRSIHKNKFGCRGKPWIEVTAAVDGNREPQGAQPDGGGQRSEIFRPVQPSPAQAPEKFAAYTGKGYFKELMDHCETVVPEKEPSPGKDRVLLEELEEMKASFHSLVREFTEVKSEWKKHWLSAKSETGCRDFDSGGSDRQVLGELQALGIGAEVLQRAAEMLETDLMGRMDTDLDSFLERFIARSVGFGNPLSNPGSGQKRLAFIGPTGVGKTTTIAKIAANYILDTGKKVLLATIDNYRIAAVEQIKIYGHIMNIPVEVARAPEQLREIFARHRDKDLILVDTAGRSPKDEISRQELAAFLDPELKTENHLVLSATTARSHLYRVIEQFGHLKLSGLVLTKLDECDLFGSLLDVPVISGHPLSFLTNGQKVPEDLLLPEPHQLARIILKRNEVVVNGISSRPGPGRNAARAAS